MVGTFVVCAHETHCVFRSVAGETPEHRFGHPRVGISLSVSLRVRLIPYPRIGARRLRRETPDNSFALLHSGDELDDPTGATRSAGRGDDLVDDHVAPTAIQLGKPHRRNRGSLQCRYEVGGHLGRRRTGVCPLPASVGFRSLHLGKSTGSHSPRRDQIGDELDVSSRPDRAGSTWSEELLKSSVIQRVAASVDPAAAQGFLQCLGIGQHRRFCGALLGQDQPHAVGRASFSSSHARHAATSGTTNCAGRFWCFIRPPSHPLRSITVLFPATDPPPLIPWPRSKNELASDAGRGGSERAAAGITDGRKAERPEQPMAGRCSADRSHSNS